MRKSFLRKIRIFNLIFVLVFLSFNIFAEDFTIKANKIETDTKKKIIYLYGNCFVKGKGVSLKADKMKLDKAKGIIIAEGHVIFIKNNVKGYGKKLIYYRDSGQATILKGELILESNFRFLADEITYLNGDRYSLKNCTFTTCPEGCNYWGFKSSKVNVKKEGYANFHSLKFTIKDKPVFYLPFFIYPAKTKRTFGLLIPEFGNSLKHGFNYKQELFIPIGQSQDVTLGIDYYSKAGTGTTFEYREAFRRGEFGRVKIYTIKDRLINERRTLGEIKYNYIKNPNNLIQIKGFLGDDFNLVRDYTFNNYDLAMRDFYIYGGYYKKLNKFFTLSSSMYIQKPYFKNGNLYTSSIPSISLYMENKKILGRDLRFKATFGIYSDDKIDGGNYSRGILNFESKKFYLLSYLNIKENLKLKTIVYSDESQSNISTLDFSYTFDFPILYKDYAHFTNTISPFLKAGYRDNSTDLNNVYHDLEDYINPSGFYVQAGVTSYFLYADKVGYLSFYGEKNLSSRSYLNPNNPNISSEYSSFNGYADIPITDNISFTSLIKYNPSTNDFDTLTVGANIYDLSLTYFKGYIYGDNNSRNSLLGWYRKKLSAHWTATIAFDYDFKLSDFRYKRITFAYYKKCIGYNITYQNNSYSTTTTNQFTVSIVLRGIGQLFKYRLGL